MKRTFLVNLLLLLFLNLLVKPFWIFGIDRVVQLSVGEESYGMYYALLNFSFLFNILLDVGITNYNNKQIAQHNVLLSKYLSRMLSTKLFLVFPFFGLSIISALLLGYKSEAIYFLCWLLVNQFLSSITLYFRSNLSGLHKFKQDSFVSVLDRVLMIAIVGALLYGNVTESSFSIYWFVYAQTCSYIITALVVFFLVLKEAGRIKLKWSSLITISVLKESWPYALLILLMTLYYKADAIMLERLLPNGAFYAGVYAKGYRLLEALNNIAYLFAALLLPIFAKMLSAKEKVKEVVLSAQNLLLPGAMFVAFLCWFFADDLMQVLYHSSDSELIKTFRWLMIGFIPMAFNYVHGTLLTANGNISALNKMAVIALLLNLSLNALLIPHYNSYGAAIATIVTQCFTAIVQFYLVVKFKLHLPNITLSLRYFVFAAALVGFYFITQGLISKELQLMALVLLSVIQAWVYKFVNLKSVISLVKQRSS